MQHSGPADRTLAQAQTPARPGARHQGVKVGDWLEKYRGMPLPQQEQALRNDPQFQKLPPQRQQALIQRLEKFNSLQPQQQQRVLNHMRQFESLTPQQREQARQLQQQLKSVPQDRRQQMRIALRNLRQMSPQERNQTLNSDQFKSRFNDQERGIISGILQIPIGSAAQNNRSH